MDEWPTTKQLEEAHRFYEAQDRLLEQYPSFQEVTFKTKRPREATESPSKTIRPRGK